MSDTAKNSRAYPRKSHKEYYCVLQRRQLLQSYFVVDMQGETIGKVSFEKYKKFRAANPIGRLCFCADTATLFTDLQTIPKNR
jgi:hypothetical protein